MKNTILLFTLIITNMTISNAQSPTFKNDQGVFVNGYDVVAYHKNYKAIRGSSDFASTANGTTYYFSSQENKEDFEENSEKYLPAFGGFCAFAMAIQNATVPTNPETFKIRDGQLFLFFNDYYEGKPFNTIVPWNGDEKNMIVKASENWKSK